MPLSIKDDHTEEVARRLARVTGETITAAIARAVEERLERLAQRQHQSVAEQIHAIATRCASLPVQDSRSADEILGYDISGLPR